MTLVCIIKNYIILNVKKGDFKLSIEQVELYFKEKQDVAKKIDKSKIFQLAQKVIDCYNNDGTVYLAANGGPVGAIDGFATDLKTHPFVLDDKSITTEVRRLKVQNLVESVGIITGVTNDIGSPSIFVEQLKNFMRDKSSNGNDVLITMSGSGNSQNIIKAFEYVTQFGVFTACISGRSGGKALETANLCLLVPGSSQFPGQTGRNDNNFHIEDFQVSITHIITGLLKQEVNKLVG